MEECDGKIDDGKKIVDSILASFFHSLFAFSLFDRYTDTIFPENGKITVRRMAGESRKALKGKKIVALTIKL